jgi:hypothetical protein
MCKNNTCKCRFASLSVDGFCWSMLFCNFIKLGKSLEIKSDKELNNDTFQAFQFFFTRTRYILEELIAFLVAVKN